ncbi:DUF1552 domain-containing protein [Microvenator marinus]|uniref:DUF1552 domain-containing protein n=1 Tax=Microvenator marinus TaxID=2600177 RepID=A0A5B8XKX1_9DELT|nr:DUF1552 domain-containing protein [Microvenator marinus]QED26462.1 DUF1552 domain-containing protein [Microvenator marinus]
MSRRTRGLTRRTILKGMLGGMAVSVGLPVLEVFLNSNGNALAQGQLIPPRFGLFFWGNGVHPERWVPTGEGAQWELSEQLLGLAGVKEEITVVSGTELKVPNVIPHTSGACGILSGTPLIVEGQHETFAGPTIDQIIADALGNETRFRSLEYGAEASAGLSYNGPDSRNPPETSPWALYDRIFGTGFRLPGEDAQVDPRIALRRSVLDAVMEDSRKLQGRVGAADKARLDQHFTSIRELELRLQRLEEDPPDRAACARPEGPLREYPALDGRAQVREKNRAMCDLVALALACDQTRVFSNYITYPVNNLLFEGASAGHHQLTHDEPGDQPEVNAIVKYLIEEFAYMVESLRAIPEGDSTLLDNCVVLGTSDVSYGRTHSLSEFPILLAGTAGGALKKGVHYRSASAENATRVPLTIARALGVQLSEFGKDEGKAADSIGALEV